MSAAVETAPAVTAFDKDPVAPEATPETATTTAETTETAPVAETSATPVAAFEKDPVAPATEDTAAGVVAPTAEAEKAPVEPITSGILGYKGPGLISKLRFSKRYFWLQDEPIPVTSLKSYIEGEKGHSDVAHHNAAWSSQNGKGLFFFVKREEDKKTPSGVISLADITDVFKGPERDVFSFKVHGKTHAFEAKDEAQRDGWHASIQTALAEAKSLKAELVASTGYTEQKDSLAKGAAFAPVAAATAAVTAATTGKTTTTEEPATTDKAVDPEPAVAETEPVEPVVPVPVSAAAVKTEKPVKETKSKSKDRSVSRKRESVFGSLFGKKEHADAEPAKEITPETKETPVTAATEEPAVAPKEEPSHATEAVAGGSALVGAAAVGEAVAADKPKETAATEMTATETTEPVKKEPKDKSRRASGFFGLFNREKSPAPAEKTETPVVDGTTETTDVAPTTAATTTDANGVVDPAVPVAATGDAEAAVVPAPTAETTATEPATTEAVVKGPADVPAIAEAAGTKPTNERRRSSFFAQYRNKPKAAAVAETKATPAAETTTEPTATEVAATEPAADATVPVASETTPAAADAKKTTTEKSGEQPSFLTKIIRRGSKLVKREPSPLPSEKAAAKPTTDAVPESAEPATDATTTEAVTTNGVDASKSEPRIIGDVVPEAITAGDAKDIGTGSVGPAPAATPATVAAA